MIFTNDKSRSELICVCVIDMLSTEKHAVTEGSKITLNEGPNILKIRSHGHSSRETSLLFRVSPVSLIGRLDY